MTNPDPDATEAAIAALDTVVDDWMRRSGVVSVEVARRWRGQQPTDEVGIRVTVERILPADEVPDGELFPGDVDGVPVDITEGRPPALERPTST
jgi:hypothetical protein